MAFTVVNFPNKVFEDFEEYRAYLAIRKKVKHRLDNKIINKTRVVKVTKIVRSKDSNRKQIYECLLKLTQS